MSSHLGYRVYKTGGEKKGYSLQLYRHKCVGTAARGKKKAFTKRRKNTRSFFSCPQFRTARIFALWRTLNAGAQRSSCCCLEHHRSLSNALSLAHSLSFSRSLSIVLFASGSVCACFFFREVFFFFFFSVKQRVREMAPIAVGDKLPDGTLFYLNSDGKPTAFPVYESLKGKKVVLVAAPGAFTPTCRLDQLPSLSCAVLLFTPQLLYMFLSCLFVNFLLLLFVRWPC